MQGNTQRYEEDTMDLRELWKTLMKRKSMIIIVTGAFALLAILYVFIVPKEFEAKAIVKISEYKLNNNNNNNNNNNKDGVVVIADAAELVKELEIIYIDLLVNEKGRDSWITRVSSLKKQKNLFELTARAYSNELAILEIERVMKYVQNKHLKILDDVKEFREGQIKQASGKLELLKTKTLPAITKKINRYQESIKVYEKNFMSVQSNLEKIKKINPTLATIQINEQKYLADMLITLRDSLEKFEDKKDNIEMIEINKLEEELNSLKSLMKPHNYKNTEVMGEIITSDYAVKPKKKLIVVAAFITGLMLSVFLAFFLEFIGSSKREEEDK